MKEPLWSEVFEEIWGEKGYPYYDLDKVIKACELYHSKSKRVREHPVTPTEAYKTIEEVAKSVIPSNRKELLKEIMKDDEELGLYDNKNSYTEKEVEDLLWKFNEYPDTLEHLDFAILLDEDEFNKFWEQNKKK